VRSLHEDMREIVYVYLIHMHDIMFIGYAYDCIVYWIYLKMYVFLDTHVIVYVYWILLRLNMLIGYS
jgi:hypothetical protein